MSIILNHLTNSLHTLNNVRNNLKQIEKISKLLEKKIKSGKKIFVYGNGGSFADASHFVGELTATYEMKSRKPLPFYLLSSNIASLTAWANDFNFNEYVSRELSCLSDLRIGCVFEKLPIKVSCIQKLSLKYILIFFLFSKKLKITYR